MSPPAAVLALLLHALVAFLLWWSSPLHHKDDPADEAIQVTMEAPPPPKPEPKPEPKPAPEPPKPPPPVAAAKPPAQQVPLPGLAPRGDVGPKNMYPKLEQGQPTLAPPPPQAEPSSPDKPLEKSEPQEPPPQQAMVRPDEPPPPPPPTLEKELPPVEAPPSPVTARDIATFAPPVPVKKPAPTPAPRPPQQQAQPPRPAPQQLPPSPLSHLQRNAPSQQAEKPRSQFVNPADTYAMNTIAESYQYRVVDQVGRYRANLVGADPNDNIVVRFTIARNGSLLAVSVVRSSGKPALDRGLVTAFHEVAPFPPLPPEIPGDSVTFTLAFGPRFRQR